jgi:hypothetical protein
MAMSLSDRWEIQVPLLESLAREGLGCVIEGNLSFNAFQGWWRWLGLWLGVLSPWLLQVATSQI